MIRRFAAVVIEADTSAEMAHAEAALVHEGRSLVLISVAVGQRIYRFDDLVTRPGESP